MTFPKADLVEKHTGTRFIPPASQPCTGTNPAGGLQSLTAACPTPHHNWEAKTRKIPILSALPLPCGGPWRDVVGCLCKKQCISAVCSHQRERVPAEAWVPLRRLTQPLALPDPAMPQLELQGRPWSVRAQLHRAMGAR